MNTKEDNAFFTSLKEGDSIGVKNNGKSPPEYRISTVERTTKAFVIVDGVKFKKENGYGYPANKRYYSLCSVGQAKEGIDYREQFLRQYQDRQIVLTAKTLAQCMDCETSPEFIAEVKAIIDKYKGEDYFYNNMDRF